jgi:hypothetical protein
VRLTLSLALVVLRRWKKGGPPIIRRLVREGRSVEESLRDEHGLREIEAEGGRLFIGQAPAVPIMGYVYRPVHDRAPSGACEPKLRGSSLCAGERRGPSRSPAYDGDLVWDRTSRSGPRCL